MAAKSGARIYWDKVGPAIYGHPQSQAAVGALGNEMGKAARSAAAVAAAGAEKDRGGKMAAAASLRLKNVRPFPSPKARALVRSKGRLEIPVALVVADHPATSSLENDEGTPVAKAAMALTGNGRWFKPPKQKRKRGRPRKQST